MRKLFLIGTALAMAAGVAATAVRARSTGNKLRRHFDRSLGQSEEELGALPGRDGKGDRLQDQRLLRHRLCRRHRSDAFQQGADRLVRQQVRHGGVDRADGEVFAQVVSRDGSIGYYSHIIVHKDSPYTKLDDILKCDKSIDFGIGDPNSTSGFLVPTSYIFATRNIDPKACFKTVRNASHQANAMAVAHKQVAAATNNSEDLQRRRDDRAGCAQGHPHHLDLADHPARSAGVAQGPRSGGQDQGLHVPHELRPRRHDRRRSRPRAKFSPTSSGRRSIRRPTISCCRSACSRPTRR